MRKVNITVLELYIRVYDRDLHLALFSLIYISKTFSNMFLMIKTIQFTDDIVIICSYKDIHRIVNSLQTAFNQI